MEPVIVLYCTDAYALLNGYVQIGTNGKFRLQLLGDGTFPASCGAACCPFEGGDRIDFVETNRRRHSAWRCHLSRRPHHAPIPSIPFPSTPLILLSRSCLFCSSCQPVSRLAVTFAALAPLDPISLPTVARPLSLGQLSPRRHSLSSSQHLCDSQHSLSAPNHNAILTALTYTRWKSKEPVYSCSACRKFYFFLLPSCFVFLFFFSR